MPELEDTLLGANKIGNDWRRGPRGGGWEGRAAKLEKLYLDNNRIGDEGAKALAAAFAEGAMPKLRYSASEQPDWRRGAVALAEAVGRARCRSSRHSASAPTSFSDGKGRV